MAEQDQRNGCRVWIAAVAQLQPEHANVLDATEQGRAGTYARAADRSRFVLGAALLKLAVADLLGRAPEDIAVERECDQCGKPHGRPRIPATDVHVSVAHSGAVVAVALTRLGPVGIDVEERTADPDPGLVARVLAPTEPIGAMREFLTYWCRKESVVKATGDGLRMPMTDVVVTPAGAPPALVGYGGQAPAAVMFDLDIAPGYAAALTVLTSQPVHLTVDRADALLRA